MKTGKTVQDLAAEIHRQHLRKRDFLLPMSNISAFVNADLLELGFETGNDLFTAPLTENGHDQLGSYCGIPAKYYDMMRKHPGLLATNVQHWLNHSSDRRLIRSLDGNIRAILSDKYRRLDNFDLAQNVLPMLNEVEASIESCEITEKKLYIKAITHKVQAEVKIGDVVSAGIIVSNSEVGHGSIDVKPLIYRLVCKNGAIAEGYGMKKYHVGRVNEMEQIEFSNETLNAEDKAFWLKIRDLVKHALSEVTFRKIVEVMQESTGLKIATPTKAIELVADRFSLNESEKAGVLNHLIQGGDLSSWGLGNAVTHAAQHVESYDRSTQLEAIGFEIMQRPWEN